MSQRVDIEPVDEATLPEFASFLQANLDSSRSTQYWETGLRTNWGQLRPNYGFVLRDDRRIVGGIGTYYARRAIGDRMENFCNITSWCVLEAYRAHSMRLAMAVTAQTGYHFTDFSPTPTVGGVLRFLRFRALDERQYVILNLPWYGCGAPVYCRPTEIERALTGAQLTAYRDHRGFAWLRHIAVGTPGSVVHVIYKPWRYKGLPAAKVLHIGDRILFTKYVRAVCSHFLLRGMISTHVECRFLVRKPKFAAIRSGFQPKLYRSDSLSDEAVDYLYSETMALDL